MDELAPPIQADETTETVGGVTIARVVLKIGDHIEIPLLLLTADAKDKSRSPCVVAISQSGKESFLKHRAGVIAELLQGGATVCLVDLRGTGESSPGGRDWRGSATTWSQGRQLFGGTALGDKLVDLRHVIRYLRLRVDIAKDRIAVWGDSFAKPNGADASLAVPLDSEQPNLGEPAGGILALLAGLYDDSLRGVAVRGSLVNYKAMLAGPFVHVPVDATAPGAIPIGDLDFVAANLTQRPLRIESPIDGQNRLLTEVTTENGLAKIQAAHNSADDSQLEIHLGAPQDDSLAKWFLKVLKK